MSTHCGPTRMRSMVNVHRSGVNRNGSLKQKDPTALSDRSVTYMHPLKSKGSYVLFNKGLI